MKKKLLMSLLVVALTVGLIGGATMAWFTDTDTAGAATFAAGTLNVDASDGLNGVVTLSDLVPTNLEPGDVTKPISIIIENKGTKNLVWFGDWTFTPLDPVKDALLDKMYIKTMGMSIQKSDGTPWSNDPWYLPYNFIVNGRGSSHDAGEANAYNIIADMSPDHVVTLRNWINNNASMAPGTRWEHMGALKPGGNKYVLTVEFGFLENAGNEYQGNAPFISPIEVGFKVDATQVNASAMDSLFTGLGTHYGWASSQIALQP